MDFERRQAFNNALVPSVITSVRVVITAVTASLSRFRASQHETGLIVGTGLYTAKSGQPGGRSGCATAARFILTLLPSPGAMAGVCTNVRMNVYQRASSSAAPAPNQYTVGGAAIGRQADSRRANAPGYSFGKSKRKGTKRASGPAPGAYNSSVSAFGKQRAVSKRPSSGSCSPISRFRCYGWPNDFALSVHSHCSVWSLQSGFWTSVGIMCPRSQRVQRRSG